MGTQNVWDKLEGTRRVQAELKYLQKEIRQGRLPQIHNLRVKDDNLLVWIFELKDFDEDLRGGQLLNEDLEELKRRYSQDHILMEITFSNSYPRNPFFLRVVSPRCQWYTGHVTSGGSICIEALTLSGTSGSWQPSFSVEGILNATIANLVDCEYVHVTTPTGPGGLAGPLRIDLGCRYHHNVMEEYTLYDAQNAFNRTVRNHKQLGWSQPDVAPSRKLASKMTAGTSQAKKRPAVTREKVQAPGPQHNKLTSSLHQHRFKSRRPFVEPVAVLDCWQSSSFDCDGIGEDHQSSKRSPLDQTCAIDLTKDSSVVCENGILIEGAKEVISLLDDDNNCTENNVGDVEEQLAEIERQFRLNESRIQTEALKKEQAMELELSAMKQKLAKLKQIPMAELPPDWTSQSEDVNRMVVTLPIPRDACSNSAWRKQQQDHLVPIIDGPPINSGPAIYKLLQAEQGFFFQRITRMFRIQNCTFWTKYCLRKADIAKEAGEEGVRETFLWHGADTAALQGIIEEGFDIRVSNMNCALGVGTYFSESARLSGDYSNMQAHAHPQLGKKKRGSRSAQGASAPGFSGTGGQEFCQVPKAFNGEKGMILARVALGRPGAGAIGVRKPEKGCHSVSELRMDVQVLVKGGVKRKREWAGSDSLDGKANTSPN